MQTFVELLFVNNAGTLSTVAFLNFRFYADKYHSMAKMPSVALGVQ